MGQEDKKKSTCIDMDLQFLHFKATHILLLLHYCGLNPSYIVFFSLILQLLLAVEVWGLRLWYFLSAPLEKKILILAIFPKRI